MSEATSQRAMPKYKCHKEVSALKIAKVEQIHSNDDPDCESDFSSVLHFEDKGYAPKRVTSEFAYKHKPKTGSYYVVYKDGYTSISPAEAFEDGYTRI